jgi:hypothetical protein
MSPLLIALRPLQGITPLFSFNEDPRALCRLKVSTWLISLLTLYSFGAQAETPSSNPPLYERYIWLKHMEETTTLNESDRLSQRIPPPSGATRVDLPPESFGAWLRGLPLASSNTPVYLFNGTLKPNQGVHEAVIKIDVGERDLQQCADAIIRLRAEFLYAQSPRGEISFQYTTGDEIPFKRWARGERPKVEEYKKRGRRRWRVRWRKSRHRGEGYIQFKRYLKNIFTYAGTASLSRELKKRNPREVQVGDLYLQGGFPGHAILVLDLAKHPKYGLIALLGQSYMPAQDPHVLKNLNQPELSPWFVIPTSRDLDTPEWTFQATDLYHF